MQFGAQVSCYRTSWDDIRRVIETLEAGSWDSIWFADHFLPPLGLDNDEHLEAHECWSVIAATAAMTERLRMGHLVLGNTFRNPALVAKMAATVDQISYGRLTLGIGASWFEREHDAYGWAFPSMRERSDRFEEACALIRAMLTSEHAVDYSGQHYQLKQAPLSPASYQKPHLPILVGGTGEKRTLRTLAMYGDIFNLDGWARGPMTAEYFHHKINVLERHCEKIDRDPSEIKRTLLMPILVTDDTDAAAQFIANRNLGEGTAAGPKSYVIDQIGMFIEAGMQEIMLTGLPNANVETFQFVDEEILAVFK